MGKHKWQKFGGETPGFLGPVSDAVISYSYREVIASCIAPEN